MICDFSRRKWTFLVRLTFAILIISVLGAIAADSIQIAIYGFYGIGVMLLIAVGVFLFDVFIKTNSDGEGL